MITPSYARAMARYNSWQNHSMIAAAGSLTPAERWRDRGAFFGSIARTLNHIYWDDRIWSARLARERRDDTIPHPHPYADEPRDWAEYVVARHDLDRTLIAWADDLADADMDRAIHWSRGDEARRPTLAFCAMHLFNHQAHHRGQVHAMLTAGGARPEPTDLHVAPTIDENVRGVQDR